jgi:hypothetical protein
LKWRPLRKIPLASVTFYSPLDPIGRGTTTARCDVCGNKVSRRDEVCPNCNNLLKFQVLEDLTSDQRPMISERALKWIVAIILISIAIIVIAWIVTNIELEDINPFGDLFSGESELSVNEFEPQGPWEQVWPSVVVEDNGSDSQLGVLVAEVNCFSDQV